MELMTKRFYVPVDAYCWAKLSTNKAEYLDGLNLHTIKYKKIKDITMQYGIYYVQSVKKTLRCQYQHAFIHLFIHSASLFFVYVPDTVLDA